MDWNQIIKDVAAQIGTAAVIIGILGLVGKVAVEKFFQSGVEVLKAELKAKNDIELAGVKHNLEKNLIKARNEAEKERDRSLQEIADQSAARDRIRAERVVWANPILNAVTGLQMRLDNILSKEGYRVLDAAYTKPDPNWSISHEYFLNSTVYLFGQYFCWVHLLELELSLELFPTHVTKDEFHTALVDVSKALGDYPLNITGTGHDTQVFRLQQQAIGEILVLRRGKARACKGYLAFSTIISKPETAPVFKPLIDLLDGVAPGQLRWNRLAATYDSLSRLRVECDRLLNLSQNPQPK